MKKCFCIATQTNFWEFHECKISPDQGHSISEGKHFTFLFNWQSLVAFLTFINYWHPSTQGFVTKHFYCWHKALYYGIINIYINIIINNIIPITFYKDECASEISIICRKLFMIILTSNTRLSMVNSVPKRPKIRHTWTALSG